MLPMKCWFEIHTTLLICILFLQKDHLVLFEYNFVRFTDKVIFCVFSLSGFLRGLIFGLNEQQAKQSITHNGRNVYVNSGNYCLFNKNCFIKLIISHLKQFNKTNNKKCLNLFMLFMFCFSW